jgi:flavodoxin
MRAVVIYESMYGNTHLIADAVADGLRPHGDVVVVPVLEAGDALSVPADLVVVGGPTHAHGMSRANTRKGAATAAEKPGAELELDPDAEGPGLRDWFETLGELQTNAAAFDTRFDLPAAFTGRASKGISRKLQRHRAMVIAEPCSFFVTKDNHLEPDEQDRAREWGEQLGSTLDWLAKPLHPETASSEHGGQ